MAAKKELVPARILCGFPLDGRQYAPGQLVGFSAKLAEQLKKMGSIDPSKDAVAASKAAGFELVEHSTEAEQDQAEAEQDQAEG